MSDRVKKPGRILITVVTFALWILLSMLCFYSTLHGDRMVISGEGTVYATFFIFPFLVMGGLFGYAMSLISFSVSFILSLIYNMENAYNMSIYLVGAMCFAVFAQYYFFSTWKKTLLASLVTIFLVAITEMLCLTVVVEEFYDLDFFGRYMFYFSREAGVILISGLLLYCFLTKTPDVLKRVFPIGFMYTKPFCENRAFRSSVRKTKVSIKLTAIIIAVELALGVFVGFFMAALFPDLRSMFANNIHRNENIPPEAMAPRDVVIEEVEQMKFRFDMTVLRYDIKMAMMMLCAGVPMAGLANFYTRVSIGGPLGAMSDFMYEFASADDDKKLEVAKKVDNIRVAGHDEIRVVGDSIKTTVHSIEDYIGRLKAEQELEKELEIAQKASEAKSSFLSNMSHEIRTPINAVLGMNEMILRESDDEQIIGYAQNVRSAGQSLLNIINDILDFSKIEAGKMDILPVEYHLSSTINDLINMIAVKAEDKGLKLDVQVNESTPTVLFGDEVRIKQCVTNILSNAVKYTERGSVTLYVDYREKDDENIYLKFRVVDTGIGIKEEDLSKLYSPFERIEEIRNRSIEGTGLGMSIVKKLLAMMDTRLEVKSVYGEGSDFSFEVEQKVVDREPIGDFREKYRQYLQSLEKYREAFRAPDARILVVDDTAVNLTVVKGLLKSTLIQVDTAESGMETLEKVKETRYDAIFIDHRMPEMDGLETLAAMKTLEGNLNKDVPCIALTANAGAGARDEYIAAGFDDYLSKPVDSKLMETMLQRYLPAEKILDAADGEALENTDIEKTAKTAETEDFLDELQGVDLEEAVKNCGSREVLRDVVREFAISIDPKSDSIEKFADDGDYRNYTVAVHALKSSARLIGAMELSRFAADMEERGNAEDGDAISEKTPLLLEMYRSYKDNLKSANKEDDSDKPKIPKEELESAFSDMKEVLEAYDFDTADGMMKMLEDYSIPEDMRDKYNKVRELMAAVDRDSLLELL